MKYADSLTKKQVYKLIQLCNNAIEERKADYKEAIRTEHAEDEQRHEQDIKELTNIRQTFKAMLNNW